MKKLLIEILGSRGLTEDSSDTAFVKAIKELLAEKDDQITTLNKQVSDNAKALAGDLIATAEAASGKKFEDAQKTALVTIAEKSGMEVFKATLAMVTPAAAKPEPEEEQAAPTPQIHRMVSNAGGYSAGIGTGREAWNYDKWVEEDPETLESMADAPVNSTEYKNFVRLYKAKFKTEPDRR